MRLTLLFACLVIIVSLFLMSQEASVMELVHDNAEVKENFVLELEFLEDNSRANALFESFGKDVEKAVYHFKNSTKIDFLFLILYPTFLFFFGKYFCKLTHWRLKFAGGICVLMSASDLGENLQLLGILNHYSGEDFTAFFPRLKLFTWLKWGAISCLFLLFSKSFFDRKEWIYKILGGFFVLSFLLWIIAFFGGVSPIVYAQSAALSIFLSLIIVFLVLAKARFERQKK
ncbi:MAG: hypothetical protein P1U70_25870 [Saprospiraceae bacterium]|jgi:hypothetical protein|nr:hypothetical protein [Saprospiraceae bacterium]